MIIPYLYKSPNKHLFALGCQNSKCFLLGTIDLLVVVLAVKMHFEFYVTHTQTHLYVILEFIRAVHCSMQEGPRILYYHRVLPRWLPQKIPPSARTLFTSAQPRTAIITRHCTWYAVSSHTGDSSQRPQIRESSSR